MHATRLTHAYKVPSYESSDVKRPADGASRSDVKRPADGGVFFLPAAIGMAISKRIRNCSHRKYKGWRTLWSACRYYADVCSRMLTCAGVC